MLVMENNTEESKLWFMFMACLSTLKLIIQQTMKFNLMFLLGYLLQNDMADKML